MRSKLVGVLVGGALVTLAPAPASADPYNGTLRCDDATMKTTLTELLRFAATGTAKQSMSIPELKSVSVRSSGVEKISGTTRGRNHAYLFDAQFRDVSVALEKVEGASDLNLLVCAYKYTGVASNRSPTAALPLFDDASTRVPQAQDYKPFTAIVAGPAYYAKRPSGPQDKIVTVVLVSPTSWTALVRYTLRATVYSSKRLD